MSTKAELREALEEAKDRLRDLEEKFAPKPVVEIIAVTHVKNRKVTIEYSSGWGSRDHKHVEGVTTIVLYSEDGELKTKAIEGTWKLEDVQKGTLL